MSRAPVNIISIYLAKLFKAKLLYLSYLYMLISVCHQRLFISTFPLFFKSDLGVEKETLSLNVTVE